MYNVGWWKTPFQRFWWIANPPCFFNCYLNWYRCKLNYIFKDDGVSSTTDIYLLVPINFYMRNDKKWCANYLIIVEQLDFVWCGHWWKIKLLKMGTGTFLGPIRIIQCWAESNNYNGFDTVPRIMSLFWS